VPGGGYNSIANANYDGTGLIKASEYTIVVVTINYRVGPYGFIASEDVQKKGSLNNGLKDIIQALQWVQAHITTVSPETLLFLRVLVFFLLAPCRRGIAECCV
jgi:carboxylesterase type B